MKVKSLAVLSMAAVSFLIGCGGSDADKKFVDQINNALSAEKSSVTTPSSAVEKVKEKGYDINSYTLTNKNYEIAFDIDTKQFLLMLGDNVSHAPGGYSKNSNSYHLFKFTDNYDNRSIYSQYLTKNFQGSDLLVVTTGLDMGENTNVKNITYFNSTGSSKDIILNVNCDYLNISTTNDNIYHYGSSNNVFIPSTLTGSYHEYGSCCYIQASGGTVYLEDGSYTDLFEIPEEYVSAVTIKQAEGSDVLARFNADIRAKSTIRCKEISDSDLTANKIQEYLDNEYYNFYRLTTEARDIVIKETKDGEGGVINKGYLEFKRSLFFDLNGRSITFNCGKSDGITYDGDSTPYYPGIHIHSGDGNSISTFLMDTQSSLYQRSGINLLDCSIIVEGNESEDKPVYFYMNSGKIHDVKCTADVPTYRNRPAVLVMGNVSNSASRTARYTNFYMYGGYIKSEWGAKADTAIGLDPYITYRKKIACKCIQPRGNGAVVNMVYGDLDSFHYCISGQGTPASGTAVDRYGKTEINIEGGYLTGGKELAYDNAGNSQGYLYTPLFLPQAGTVTITGAHFTGPSCINAKAGTINIKGGTFTATKEYDKDVKASGDGSAADGSVIFMESNGFYQGAKDSNLTINVEDATMTSKYAYIVKNSGYIYNDSCNKSTINFTGGTFNYALGEYATDLTGESLKYFECNITGGTWNKVA